MSEKIYDDEIAPLLLKAAQLCHMHGLPIVAQVEYAPGEFGFTSNLGKTPGVAIQMVQWAALAQGNLDAFMIRARRHCDEHGHNSIVMAMMEGSHSP